MDDCKEIIRRLRRIAIDKFRYFGCGYEHNCGIHGCAVVRDAVTTIETLTAELSDLQHRYEKMSDYSVERDKLVDQLRAELGGSNDG